MKRIFSWFFALLISSFLQAQIPNIIPYQGSITDTSDIGFDGDFDFEFKILNSSNTSLWSSGTISVPVNNGNYSVSLGGSGQPTLPKSIFDLDEIYLEVSFNDGVTGKETLSPNVRILPVPYALRAAYADSASNSANFNIGDSLVLKDKNGNVRFVLNPNTGEFKMMDNDTVWHSLQTNSPPKVVQQLPNGGSVAIEYETDPNGASYHTYIYNLGGNKGKIVSTALTEWPNGDPNPIHISDYLKYCPDGTNFEYTKTKIQYVRDTTIGGVVYRKGIHVFERWFDCTGVMIRDEHTSPNFKKKSFEKPANAVVEMVSEDEHIIIYTVGQDTFQSKVNPKTGEIRHSKRWVSHVVGLEGGKTVSTYNNDQTGKSASTTVDPDNKKVERKNQDVQLYIPLDGQQCIGTDLGNGDTLWLYMSTQGFVFNDNIKADVLKADTFEVIYDDKPRVRIWADDKGNSAVDYYDGVDQVIRELRNPKTGEVKKEGVRMVKIEYDGNNNVVLEYDSTGGSKQTNQSGSIKIIESVDPVTGEVTHTKEWVRHVMKMEKGKTVATYHNDSTKKSASTTVDPDKNSVERKNQDIQLYIPLDGQQCIGTDIGNGDTLWIYMSDQGFDFNDVIRAEGIKSDSFVAQYDGNDRVVVRGEKNGNSTTRYYDDGGNIIEETRNPKTGEVKTEGIRIETREYDANNNVIYEFDSTGGSKRTNRSGSSSMSEDHDPKTGTTTYDGYDRQVYDERDLTYEVSRDSGRTKNKVTNTGGTVSFEWEYDANENVVWTEGNGVKEEKKHNKDSTITFVWTDDDGNPINLDINPKQKAIQYELPGGLVSGSRFPTGRKHDYVYDQNNRIESITTPNEKSVRYTGVTKFGFDTDNVETGFEFDKSSATSWFGGIDTAKKNSMAIGFTQFDSSISLIGGNRFQVMVPDQVFQNIFDDGNHQMGIEWDFVTNSHSIVGINSSQILFPSQVQFIQEAPSGQELMLMTIDTNQMQLGMQLIPSQGLMQLDAGRNPTFFVSSFLEAENSLFVNDSAFVDKFLAVNGNMVVGGNLQVNGTVGKGGGTFRIDHPQDPYNKYLYHSFVESPDMMNIYNGNAVTNEDGEVVVEMPEYFEALNMEFRYQLTCIGSFAQAIVGEEIEGNKFTIMTDKPNVKVSWQVTGIRQDAFANDNRVQVEVDKEPENVGSLLYTPKQTKK